jgi:hypothetical protein
VTLKPAGKGADPDFGGQFVQGPHPAPDTTGVNRNAAIHQKFGNVFIEYGIAQVPADTKNNHLTRKWRPERMIGVIGMEFYPTGRIPKFSQWNPPLAVLSFLRPHLRTRVIIS